MRSRIIRATPATRELLAAAMREIAAVATAKGVQLPSDAVQQAMAFIDVAPPETTASMQRDLAAGRPSELEHQTGSVVRMGKQLGVATPLNAFLYACLLPTETLAREVSQ